MDTLAGLGFEPTEFVDISSEFATKASMLRAHESQQEWLSERYDQDICEQIEIQANFRGMQCGVKYAEAFRSCLTWLRARPERLLP